MVGAEAGRREVMERVDLVTRSDVTVLLLGETGTGKEVIARVIHSHSARDPYAFLRVNCGAIPPELIDSELFGHERGAFTGATETRPGWFERADGGTLLLDEVGELPLAAQVRLLRILQDGWLERVGGGNRFTSTCGSWPPPIGTWQRWWPSGGSAKTSGTAWPCSRSSCRRYGNGAKTSPPWPSTLPTGRQSASPCPSCFPARRTYSCSASTVGPETSANWAP